MHHLLYFIVCEPRQGEAAEIPREQKSPENFWISKLPKAWDFYIHKKENMYFMKEGSHGLKLSIPPQPQF